MQTLTHHLICRMTLLLMLATFLSPSLGWQMVIVHDHDGRSGHHVGVLEHHDDQGAHHDDIGDGADLVSPDTHLDAHSMMGHLLGHMPASLAHIQLFDAPTGRMVLNAPPPDGMSHAIPDRLFRPPLSLLV